MGIEGALPSPAPGFDVTRTFVQVIEHRPDGFVEFRFAIGDPNLFVEMLLSETAYEEFRSSSGAEVLPPLAPAPDPAAEGEHPDDEEWDWTLRDATHQRFK